MIRAFLVLALFSISLAQADTRVGVFGSYLWNNPVNNNFDNIQGAEADAQGGFGVGLRALANLTDQFLLRTGAGIVQKSARFEFSDSAVNGSSEYNVTYLSIPATLYVKASPQFGVFFGTALQAKLDDSCKGSISAGGTSTKCQVQDAGSLVMPAILGFDWAFTDHLSLELSYEYSLMNAVKDTKIHSAVASIVYNFDQE